MNTKPFFITKLDYKLLKEKYSDEKLDEVLKKIRNGYPVQYAIGNVEFLNSKILVDERVLIPRFETELLVHNLLNELKGKTNLNILDLCTGSGCIAISLKKDLPDSNIDAVDISIDALNLAQENAKINETDINFYQMDILNEFSFNKTYDVIVSNPPYVSLLETVDESTKFEPQNALYPGKDELIFYKTILKNIKPIINKKTILAFEIGSTQGIKIKSIAENYFPNAIINIKKDFNNFDRFVFIKFE